VAAHPVGGGPSRPDVLKDGPVPSRRSQGRTRPVRTRGQTGCCRPVPSQPKTNGQDYKGHWHRQLFASGRLPTGRLLEILSGEAVASLQMVKTGGEAFAGACHDGVRFLLFVRSVPAATCFGELSADPFPGLRTFSF